MSFSLYVYAPTDGISSLTVGYSTGESYYTYPAGTSTSCHSNTAATDGATITITPRITSGYQFSRWVINADGNVSYSYSSTLTYRHTGASAVHLRVEVEQLLTYYATFAFNANGGTGAPSSVSGYTIGSSTVSLTIPYTTPTREGHTFDGWLLTYTGGSSVYQPGSTANVIGSTGGTTYTLIAIWTAVPVYYATIAFDANGGSGAPSSVTGSNTENSTVTLIIPDTTPTKKGFTFIGWQLTYTGGSSLYQPGGIANVQGNVDGITYTLVAVWEDSGGGIYLHLDSWASASIYIHVEAANGWIKAAPYVWSDTEGWQKGI